MKLRFKTRTALLLVCALVLGACGLGVHAAIAERAKQEALARETRTRIEQLAASLVRLRDGRQSYLAGLASLEAERNDYETQKDLVRIAADAVEKRRASVARAEASGTLTGGALTEARQELADITAEFDAQKKAVGRYEDLQTRVEAYEKQKAQARALLDALRKDTRIQSKLDAGMGPLAAARQALREEAAALRRQYYCALAVFAALGAAALAVLFRALRASAKNR